jgi:hypothetical protein
MSGQRSLRYPNIKRRVTHLCEAAEAARISVPTSFEADFIAETEPGERTTKLLVSVADAASADLVQDLRDLAWRFADDKGVPARDVDKVSGIRKEFRNGVAPTSTRQTLVDILNAGWECRLDPDLWTSVSQIDLKDRFHILGDLMLKSMEVAEIHERLEK